MELEQTASQSLTLAPQQMLGLSLLQMNDLEIQTYLQQVSLENPVIDLCDPAPLNSSVDDYLKYQEWINEYSDQTERYHELNKDEISDSLSRITSETSPGETMQEILRIQLSPLKLESRMQKLTEFLIESLDENGYFTDSVDDLSSALGIAPEEINKALQILQTLEPAGIGARDLRECLYLQLKRRNGSVLAKQIISEKLDALAKKNYQKIAAELSTTLSSVQKCAHLIQSLDPYPWHDSSPRQKNHYIIPEITVEKINDEFSVSFLREEQPYFTLNPFYISLYHTTDDPIVKKYLTEKFTQVRIIQWGIAQRKNTLQRCVLFLIDYQKDFFCCGPQKLLSLTMTAAAEAISIHPSTVSRAVRGKYLLCNHGVFPLSYFFSSGIKSQNSSVSSISVKEKIKKMIEETPGISDQKLADKLNESGYRISRRTVNKYRNQLNLPNAYYREK